MAEKPKALLLGNITFAKDLWRGLASISELIELKASSREEFIAQLKSGVYDGVVVAYRSLSSVKIIGPIDQELIDYFPKSLKFLSINSAGYDTIDVGACTARNPPLWVSNATSEVTDSTSTLTMFLIIGAVRNFNAGLTTLHQHKWLGQPPIPYASEPTGKTMGILGMGRIGLDTKRKADVFGIKTIYHNRHRLSQEQSGGAKYCSFDDLLARSDILCLTLPLNPKTRHIISTKEFEKMKQGVIIINSARGALIDEDALVKSLESGKVARVGLDVYENEPEIHPGLIRNPNALLVPHMGTYTVETLTNMEAGAVENVRFAIEAGKLHNVVPEQSDLVPW